MEKTKEERQAELTALLDKAAKAYEQEDREIISNYEYDALYDELLMLEKETGVVLENSPTKRAGYEVLSELPKFRHESPMLSLDKTKEPAALASFLGSREGVLSWKMDGLTVVLTYRHGTLFRAVTRGNGEIGEVVTPNALTFKNIPKKIDFDGELVLRGEAIIKYSDFEKINAALPPEEQFKNPRNLCSGAVRQLNSRVTAQRRVNCVIFALISMKEMDGDTVRQEEIPFETRSSQFEFLRKLGFETVEYTKVTGETVEGAVRDFAGRIASNDFPSDGLVLCFEDIAYGRSLGRTAKFPRDSIAFKWRDETAETTLRYIEWSASRTGLINPVAVFEPVELEGTTVSRASVHNVSIVEELRLGTGDRLRVYKANMIIPQIAENLTKSGTCVIPAVCPVCGGRTEVRSENESKVLVCVNPECQAKKIKSFAHFVSRDAMNIDGMSESTVEKLVDAGCVHCFADLFRLEEHKDVITGLEGFGQKSYENLKEAAERAKDTTLYRILYSMGVNGVGLSTAKLICRALGESAEKLVSVKEEELVAIDGVGAVTAGDLVRFFGSEANREQFMELVRMCRLHVEKTTESAITGKTFVITGDVTHFENRSQFKNYIESLGGKVTGSVTGKTDYLISNDKTSNSGKSKTARELGISIISEDEFLELAKQ
jgi:DNA ligase (NAD+)